MSLSNVFTSLKRTRHGDTKCSQQTRVSSDAELKLRILPKPCLGDWQKTELLEYVKNAARQLECQKDRMLNAWSSARQRSSLTSAQLREIMDIESARQLPHDGHDIIR